MATVPDFVEQLLVTCLDRDPDAWEEAVSAAALAHPEWATELRARFAAIQGIEPPQASFQAPRQLGDYVLGPQIGSGGMGVVFRARQASLDRDVAVKIVRPEYQLFDQARARFAREIEAVARLQHPSVVAIHAVGGPQDPPYYAMELLPGRTLAQILQSVAGRAADSLHGADLAAAVGVESKDDAPDGSPPVFAGSWNDACLELCAQVADALAHAHAHARQILHRDIKSSNIIVTPDGRAVILDFGLASLMEGPQEQRLTRTGSSLGTIAYMAPERVQGAGRATLSSARAAVTGEGQRLDADLSRGAAAATDTYSLGVTLYELLALRLPYDGEELAQTQAQILDGHPSSHTHRAGYAVRGGSRNDARRPRQPRRSPAFSRSASRPSSGPSPGCTQRSWVDSWCASAPPPPPPSKPKANSPSRSRPSNPRRGARWLLRPSRSRHAIRPPRTSMNYRASSNSSLASSRPPFPACTGATPSSPRANSWTEVPHASRRIWGQDLVPKRAST